MNGFRRTDDAMKIEAGIKINLAKLMRISFATDHTETRKYEMYFSAFPCTLWQKKLLIVFHFVNKNDTRKN